MLRSSLNAKRLTLVPGFTLIETLIVIAIMSIIFIAMAPAIDAFQVRSQVKNATDRTKQIIDQAKTLAISGFRPGNTPDKAKFFVVDIKNGAKRIPLCMQDLDPKVTDLAKVDIKDCPTTSTSASGNTIVNTAELGQISVFSSDTKIAFFPPFGEARVVTSNAAPYVIILKQGNSTLPRAQSKLLFTRATGRVEVQ